MKSREKLEKKLGINEINILDKIKPKYITIKELTQKLSESDTAIENNERLKR
ncbi:MAG: hypothetical protein K8R49_01340 [Candidatus Cloacimonetes bacterium]|nr:hypothetical protein [Candidatus Cloacimonadota bacterium]